MGAHLHSAPRDVPCHCPKHMDPHTSPPSHGQGPPALLSRNVTTSWPALGLHCSCHLDPVSWCLVEQERFLFQEEIQTPPKGGPSSSGRVFSTWPCGAGQSAISFPSSRCRHAAGRLPAPLCTCSASVCLSKVQSQPHLAINKYVSRLTASLIIIITPKLEGWHSHRDA